MPNPNKAALVLIGDGLGNLIEGTPLVRAVMQLYSPVDIWAARSLTSNCQVLQGFPGVRTIYNGKNPPPRYYAAAFATFQLRGYLDSARAMRRYWADQPWKSDRNEAEVNLDAVRKAGWRGEMPAHYVAVGEAPAQYHGQPLLALAPNCAPRTPWRRKRYKRYQEFVDLWCQQPEYAATRFLVLGFPTDDAVTHANATDLRGQTASVCDVAAVLQQCKACVGNDCGLTHLAAALGLPTLVIFGPTLVSKNLPPRSARALSLQLACQPCQYSRYGVGKRPDGERCSYECLQELTPQMVVTALRDLLGH